MPRAVLVLAAFLLAGCAGDPAPGEGTGAAAEGPPAPALAGREVQRIEFALGTAVRQASQPVTLPQGTEGAWAEVRATGGAAETFLVAIGSCYDERPVLVAGDPPLRLDCPDARHSTDAKIVVQLRSGQLQGEVVVFAYAP